MRERETVRVVIEDYPEVCTVEEYAGIIRRSRTAAYEDVRKGRIESIRLGRTIRIPRRAIEALVYGDEPKLAGIRAVK